MKAESICYHSQNTLVMLSCTEKASGRNSRIPCITFAFNLRYILYARFTKLAVHLFFKFQTLPENLSKYKIFSISVNVSVLRTVLYVPGKAYQNKYRFNLIMRIHIFEELLGIMVILG